MPRKTKTITLKQFERMKPRDQAVMIAKDVISQIVLGKYAVTAGTYLSMDRRGKLAEMLRPDEETGCLLPGVGEKQVTPQMLAGQTCYVCAKGSLYLSHIRLANKATINEVDPDVVSEDDMEARLVNENNVFDPITWDLMECAFEVWGWSRYLDNHSIPDEDSYEMEKLEAEVWRARDFGLNFEDEDIRLAAIMLNVIANKGVFKPKKPIPTEKQVKKALKDSVVIVPQYVAPKKKRKAKR